MDTNEPGREPTEPTDAELLLRFGKEVRAAKLGVGKMSDGEALLNAIIARGEEYLSGQRPMPDTTAPDEQDATLVKLIDLLTRTANAVKGQPGEMKQHGWADLPELCTALTARAAGLEAALRMFLEAGLGNSTDVVQQRAAVFNAAKLLTAPTHTAPGGEGGGK